MKIKSILIGLILSSSIASAQLGSQDILAMNAQFGYAVPDIQPDFYGYYPDITGGFDSFSNLSNVHGSEDSEIIDQFTYVWQFKSCEDCKPYWEGQGYEIAYNEIWNSKTLEPCEGAFWVTLVAIRADMATFQMTKPAYAFWGGVDYPNCDFGLGLLDHFNYPLQPDYEPYQYQVRYAVWDINQNNIRDTADLIHLLSLYQGN